MRKVALLVLTSFTLLPLGACRSNAGRDSGNPGGNTTADTGTGSLPRATSGAPERSGLTGTLQSGVAAIGGETTGWRLVGDGQTGGIDVDVSRVEDRAKALAGRRVTITGRMTERDWPERGNTQVLVAERIQEAEQKKSE